MTTKKKPNTKKKAPKECGYNSAIEAIKAAKKNKRGIILGIDNKKDSHVILHVINSLEIAQIISGIFEDHPEIKTLVNVLDLMGS